MNVFAYFTGSYGYSNYCRFLHNYKLYKEQILACIL